jgi:hypothetical protein
MTGTDSAGPSCEIGAEPRWKTQVSRFGPGAQIALMLVVALTLGLGFVDFGAAPVADPLLPSLALTGVWLALELVVLHLQFGKDLDNAEQITLSEIALGLGLLFSVPASLLLAGIASSLLVDLLRWRKKTSRWSSTAPTGPLKPPSPSRSTRRSLLPTPLSAQGWGALCLAATASSLVSALDVAGVIRLSIGRLPGRDFLFHVGLPHPSRPPARRQPSSRGLALQAGPAAAAPLLVSFVVLLALVRSFSLLAERHLNLASLHSLGSRLGSVRDVGTILGATLDASADLLIARASSSTSPSHRTPRTGPGTSRSGRRAEQGVGATRRLSLPTGFAS